MVTKSYRIGVTTRIVSAPNSQESRDAIAHDWAKYLKIAVPNSSWMALPNIGKDDIIPYCTRWNIDALILSGGDDIGKTLLRDETEFTLVNWAAENKIPLLGVCRGMEILGKFSGTQLIPVENHVGIRHKISGSINGETNSYHHLALENVPQHYTLLAKSEDNHIEAIQHDFLPWIACMWHPEREQSPQSIDLKMIRELFA